MIGVGCKNKRHHIPLEKEYKYLSYSENILHTVVTPKNLTDKSGLMFSDQGAWFMYSFPDTDTHSGFSGPFLLTQQNGIWSSQMLVRLNIQNVIWDKHKTTSFNSHLIQVYANKKLELEQKLVYLSGHTALIKSTIRNKSNTSINLSYNWQCDGLLSNNLKLKNNNNELIIHSSKSDAIGHILFPNGTTIASSDSTYTTKKNTIRLAPGAAKEIVISNTFIFPEYSWEQEKNKIKNIFFDAIFDLSLIHI